MQKFELEDWLYPKTYNFAFTCSALRRTNCSRIYKGINKTEESRAIISTSNAKKSNIVLESTVCHSK